MGNLFAGLESLGLNIKDNVDVYEKEKKENQIISLRFLSFFVLFLSFHQ